MDLPRLINWSITDRCNLDCRFCFRHRTAQRASWPEKLAILERIALSGIGRLTLTGGEPLLEAGLPRLLEISRDSRLFVSLHTNALLDEAFFSVFDLVDRISFALDGPDADTCDSLRGFHGYFDSVLAKMEHAASRGKDFTVKTVITQRNIRVVPRMATLLARLRPTYWSLFQFRPLRQARAHEAELAVTDAEFAELIQRLAGLGGITLDPVPQAVAVSNPIFHIVGRGEVYTSHLLGDDVQVGSLLESDVATLWARIRRIHDSGPAHLRRYALMEQTRPGLPNAWKKDI